MASPGARAWLEYWMAYCLERYEMDESRSIFRRASAKVSALGEDGATVDQWVAIITDLIIERHPEDTMAVAHARRLFERRGSERPS